MGAERRYWVPWGVLLWQLYCILWVQKGTIEYPGEYYYGSCTVYYGCRKALLSTLGSTTMAEVITSLQGEMEVHKSYLFANTSLTFLSISSTSFNQRHSQLRFFAFCSHVKSFPSSNSSSTASLPVVPAAVDCHRRKQVWQGAIARKASRPARVSTEGHK